MGHSLQRLGHLGAFCWLAGTVWVSLGAAVSFLLGVDKIQVGAENNLPPQPF